MFILITFICSSFFAYSADRNPRSSQAQAMIAGSGDRNPSGTGVVGIAAGAAMVTVLSKSQRNLFVTDNDLLRERAHTPCPYVLQSSSCEPEALPIPGGQLNFMRAFARRAALSNPDVPADGCNCLKEQLGKDKDPETFENEKKAETERLNQLILKSAGEKFINDFTVNFEDASYLLVHSQNIFSNKDTAADIECRNPEAYRAKAIAQCGSTQGEEFINRRMDLLLNAPIGGNGNFNDRLRVISDESLSEEVETDLAAELSEDKRKQYGLESQTTRRYYRAQYDNLRRGLVYESEKTKTIDIVFGHIIRNEAFNSRIQSELAAGKTPYEVMFDIIKENKNNRQFINDTGAGAQNFSKAFPSDEEIDKSLGLMVSLHPGYMRVLQNKDLFQQVMTSARNRTESSILVVIDNDKTILESHMRKSCETLIENFAKSVCIPDEKLLASVAPDELEKIVHPDEPEQNRDTVELHQLLLCEARQSSNEPTRQMISLDTAGGRRSDYFVRNRDRWSRGSGRGARTAGEAGGEQQGMALVLASVANGDPSIRDEFNRFTDIGSSNAGTPISPNISSVRAYAEGVSKGRAVTAGRNQMSRESANRYLAQGSEQNQSAATQTAAIASTNPAGTTESTSDSQQTSSNQSATVASMASTGPGFIPTPSYVAPVGSTQTVRDAREQLRDYVAETSGFAEADRVVKELDDPTVLEMNRLRAQNQALLEESLKAETKKYEELKARLAQLETGESSPAQGQGTQERTQDSVDRSAPTNLSSLRQSFAPQTQVQRAPASVQSTSAGSARVSGTTSVSRAAASSSSSDEGSSRGRRAESASGLTLTATSVQPADVQTQAVNQEVRKLLENPATNVASLEEIKQKGFVYRYTTVENDKVVQKEIIVKYENLDQATKDALEVRLTKKAVDNQVSKLAVLRMLIRSNTGR